MERGTWAERLNVSKVDMNCQASLVDRKGNYRRSRKYEPGNHEMMLEIMNKTLCSSSNFLLEEQGGQRTILRNLLSGLPPSPKQASLTLASAGTFKNTEIKSKTTILINKLNK